MARPIRVEFTDAVYHVTARANERKTIYRDDRDRQRFLETGEKAHDQFGLLIHAYCLMPNHYHLLIQTPRANLSSAVGWLQTTYTIRFKRRHRRSGHLYQGRRVALSKTAENPCRWHLASATWPVLSVVKRQRRLCVLVRLGRI